MMKHSKLRQPGVEPGSIAWKATMLAATSLTLVVNNELQFEYVLFYSVWSFDDKAFKTASAGS